MALWEKIKLHELPTTIYFVLPSQIFSLDQKISLFALRNQVRAAVTMSVANVTCFDFGHNKRFATANSTVRSLLLPADRCKYATIKYKQ